MLEIAIVLLCIGRSQVVLVPIAAMCAILGVTPVYNVQQNLGQQNSATELMPHTSEADERVVAFLNANSKKTLKKLIAVEQNSRRLFAP